jgi:hypothetical protein
VDDASEPHALPPPVEAAELTERIAELRSRLAHPSGRKAKP